MIFGQKRRRVRLAEEPYRDLRLQVLRRDGWRCQKCGVSTNLHVHHIEPRSALGDDSETNLITLCAGCHEIIHQRRNSEQ
jgi:predicted HNH restriction endonuclease